MTESIRGPSSDAYTTVGTEFGRTCTEGLCAAGRITRGLRGKRISACEKRIVGSAVIRVTGRVGLT